MNLINICVDATYDSGCFNEQQNQMTTYVYSTSTDYTSETHNGCNDILSEFFFTHVVLSSAQKVTKFDIVKI